MTILEQLNNNFPRAVNKAGVVLSTMLKSFAAQLEKAQNYAKEYYSNPSIYNQEDQQLKTTLKYLSYFDFYIGETEDNIKRRFSSVFTRKGDTSWGNPIDIVHVFQSAFPSANIYIDENTGDLATDNLISNYNFDSLVTWNINDEELVYLSADAVFSNKYGVAIKTGGKLSKSFENKIIVQDHIAVEGDTYETLAVEYYSDVSKADYIKNYSDNPEVFSAGDTIKIPSFNVYNLHFMLKRGSCKITIKDNNGKYFNNDIVFSKETELWTYGKWQDDEINYEYKNESSSDWKNCGLYFNAGYDSTNFEIIIETDEGCYFDYPRLFLHDGTPTFTILAEFGEASSSATAYAVQGHSDTGIPEEKLDSYSYYSDENNNYNFITGYNSGGLSDDAFSEMLDYCCASGIKGYVDVITKIS